MRAWVGGETVVALCLSNCGQCEHYGESATLIHQSAGGESAAYAAESAMGSVAVSIRGRFNVTSETEVLDENDSRRNSH